MRIHSPHPNPGAPIVVLGGGPGLTNMKARPPDRLLASHDVVIVGYRGVDGSVKLDGPEVRRAMRGVGKDLLGPASRANFGRAIRQSAARMAEDGIDLGGYTIPEVVEDLEDARMALGQPTSSNHSCRRPSASNRSKRRAWTTLRSSPGPYPLGPAQLARRLLRLQHTRLHRHNGGSVAVRSTLDPKFVPRNAARRGASWTAAYHLQLAVAAVPRPVRSSVVPPSSPPLSLTPATGCAGHGGDADSKPALVPATTAGKPPISHEDHELQLEYQFIGIRGCFIAN
ncbi:MAG TPA: hypothetical protein VFZ87_01550 [Gemmatimonadales bacterium]